LPKKIDSATAEELAAYAQIYFATWDVVEAAKVRIKKRLNADLPQAERDELELALLRLEAEHKKLQIRRRAWERGQAAIKPPTDKQVQTVKDALAEVEALTATARAISSAIALADTALKEFGKVQAGT
jgi:hypothetical protein